MRQVFEKKDIALFVSALGTASLGFAIWWVVHPLEGWNTFICPAVGFLGAPLCYFIAYRLYDRRWTVIVWGILIVIGLAVIYLIINFLAPSLLQ